MDDAKNTTDMKAEKNAGAVKATTAAKATKVAKPVKAAKATKAAKSRAARPLEDDNSMLKEAVVLLQILRLIPTTRRICSSEIQRSLLLSDIRIGTRTLQRYLKTIAESPVFGVECDRTNRPYGYRRLPKQGRFIGTPLTTNESLLIRLAQEELRDKLPLTFTESLTPLFDEAARTLKERRPERIKASEWVGKVGTAPAVLPRVVPVVKPRIFEAITDALFEDRLLEVEYTKRNGVKFHGFVSPLGLVHQDGRLYLVALPEGREEFRHYAIHRFENARMSGTASRGPENFDLKAYLAGTTFNFSTGRRILLRIVTTNPNLIRDLKDSPLTTGQKIWDTSTIDVSQWVVDVVLEESRLIDAWLVKWRDEGASTIALSCPVEDVDAAAYEKSLSARFPIDIPALAVRDTRMK